MPGMKWSTVLVVASIGTRVTADQFRPSVDVLSTMSLLRHPLRNRQSCQTTYTLPAPSISAEGSGPDRRLPASAWLRTRATLTDRLHVPPPSVDRNEMIAFSNALAAGTTTVPFGCTTGCPPSPVARLAVATGVPQVSPPSCDVLMRIRSPAPKSSNSV